MFSCWGYSSVVEHLPGLCETLGSIFRSEQKKQNKQVEQFTLSSTDSKIINKISYIQAVDYYPNIQEIGKEILCNMDTPRRYYVKRKKPITTGHVL